MYKIIIVDDEKKVCQLLLRLAHWKEFGIEVMGICHDGKTALEKILEVKPDIVLTDIRIPGYDGLELIDRVIREGIHCEFIVISGYKYFEYAYSAMKVGVVDYLLKPIEEQELNDTLSRTCRLIEEKKNKLSSDQKARQIIQSKEEENRKQLFTDLVNDKFTGVSSVDEINQKYCFDFSQEGFLVSVLGCNQDLKMENLLFENKVVAIGQRIFAENQAFVLSPMDSQFICIINYEPGTENIVKRKVFPFFYDVSVAAKAHGNLTVTMGMGNFVKDLELLPDTTRRAIKAEAAKIVLGDNRVIDLSEYHFEELPLENIVSQKEWRQLNVCLESFNCEKLNIWMDEICAKFRKINYISPEIIFDFCEILIQRVQQCVMEIGNPDYQKEVQLLEVDCLKVATVPRLFEMLKEKLTHIFERIREERYYLEKKPIRFAKAYISENYMKPLTLESVADEVGLNPAYLSSLFKKICSKSFIEYLTETRMDAAKELLKRTNLTNRDIAGRVGYNTDKYFIRVFKKETGVRPNDYRRLYSGDE